VSGFAFDRSICSSSSASHFRERGTVVKVYENISNGKEAVSNDKR
jgi:hypothetical protein